MNDQPLEQHIQLLRYQIQQQLTQQRLLQQPRLENVLDTSSKDWQNPQNKGLHYEVQCHPHIETYRGYIVKPDLAIAIYQPISKSVHTQWALDINLELHSQSNGHNQRSQHYAQAGIAEYWALSRATAELRVYSDLSHAPECSQGAQPHYQKQQLLQVGQQATPSTMPELTFQLKESLPIYFLTRTLSGHRSYRSAALPLALLPIT